MNRGRNIRMVTYNGARKPLAEWSKQLRIPLEVLRCRIYDMDWSVKRAFETPYVNSKRKVKDGADIDMSVIMQYVDLQEELKEVNIRIAKTEAEIAKIREEGTVVDVVKGGMGGTQHFKVEGFPDAELGRKEALLFSRKAIQSSLKAEISETINKIEEIIGRITDSRTRRLFDLKIIQQKTWSEVSVIMGGTPDSLRMEFNRFFEKL